MTDQSDPILLTRKQAATMLAVSVMTIIRMQERGGLTAVRLPGGAVRCLMTEVEGLTRKVKRLKPSAGLRRRPGKLPGCRSSASRWGGGEGRAFKDRGRRRCGHGCGAAGDGTSCRTRVSIIKVCRNCLL